MGKNRLKRKRREKEKKQAAENKPPPPPPVNPDDLPFTKDELEITEKVVKIIGENTENILNLPILRDFRRYIQPIIEEQVKKHKFSQTEEKIAAFPPAYKKRKLETLDQEFINATKLRADRLKYLESLNEEGKDEVAVLDGVAGAEEQQQLFLMNIKSDQLQLCAGEDIKIEEANEKEEKTAEKIELNIPKKCYICKKPFVKLHFFYDQLCPECADFNYKKRNELVNMTGKVCLVTGARVKIGFRCALKLLRCGATVIATTRFPNDAIVRFTKESDYSVWKDKLHIYGLDFRNIPALELFCSYLNSKWNRLDVIINNACQTIRRPPVYYSHLLENEFKYKSLQDVPVEVRGNLQQHFNFTSSATLHPSDSLLSNTAANTSKSDAEISISDVTGFEQDDAMSTNIKSSKTEEDSNLSMVKNSQSATAASVPLDPSFAASMTQLQVVKGDEFDEKTSAALFPIGLTDVNAQQIDLRTKNSWMLKLNEVPTGELAEVMVINAIAPTVLNAKLKPLMEFDLAVPKFIVNVSAMEGKFYRYKSETHPHTNMAKAALNMMTRTSAQDYVSSNIYMTAVDTGWINDEKPIHAAVKHMKTHNFQTPLDEIDAAARVLDPVIAPLKDLAEGRNFEPQWGIFLKDFKKCEW